MSVATISIQLDQEAAQIYTSASDERRKKLHLLLGLWLREFDNLSLSSLMNRISDNAEDRGLTSEILESLLRDN